MRSLKNLVPTVLTHALFYSCLIKNHYFLINDHCYCFVFGHRWELALGFAFMAQRHSTRNPEVRFSKWEWDHIFIASTMALTLPVDNDQVSVDIIDNAMVITTPIIDDNDSQVSIGSALAIVDVLSTDNDQVSVDIL
ncbi:uncharacterized protein LOC120073587 [Benincasa hispida]|uniref:uncharacterized protein LOC120073587 n=1 Tax=Benincasa hispida TaxID=102211 RepID=UPI0018FF21D1|nr:uncharacterized protein LOC120073587 [Benincasa hispida]